MKALILHDRVEAGSREDEKDVLVQAEAVSKALIELGWIVVTEEFTLDLPEVSRSLKEQAPDIVFNLVESVEGQGRLIHLAPALLDSMGIPYTGAPTEAMFCTSNKILGKTLLRGTEIPTPDWVSLNQSNAPDLPTPGRYVIKSVWEHASIGLDESSVVEVETGEELRQHIRQRLPLIGGEGFAEAYIEGREFNLSLLAGEVLPPAEIIFEGYPADRLKIVDYSAKWASDSFEYHNTPRRFEFPQEDDALLDRLKTLAQNCWRLFGLRGYARVDFRVDSEGCPWVLEVNTNPCLSPDAGYAAALAQAGLDFESAVKRIIQDATE